MNANGANVWYLSKKMWVLIGSVLIILLDHFLHLGLPDDTRNDLWKLAVGYLLAEGACDAAGAIAKGMVKPCSTVETVSATTTSVTQP